jgi:hypothetical protein
MLNDRNLIGIQKLSIIENPMTCGRVNPRSRINLRTLIQNKNLIAQSIKRQETVKMKEKIYIARLRATKTVDLNWQLKKYSMIYAELFASGCPRVIFPRSMPLFLLKHD